MFYILQSFFNRVLVTTFSILILYIKKYRTFFIFIRNCRTTEGERERERKSITLECHYFFILIECAKFSSLHKLAPKVA